MDKLRAMGTFVRVVETGSFSAVANEADSTQSAISKQVSALEQELGVKLLTRTTRSLAMTQDGERYFEQARRLVAEIAEAEDAVRSGEQRLVGRLRIASAVAFGRLKLMPAVQTFLAAHPKVKVDLRLADGFVDLVEQGIDISVRIGELEDSTLVARRVGTTRRTLLAHRSYLRSLPRGRKAPKTLEDLADHNCIVYTESSPHNSWTFQSADGARRTVPVDGNLQTNSSVVIRAAVLAGMGIAYAPTWVFDEEIKAGEIVRLMPEWEGVPLPISLVSPPERKHSAKVKAFADHMARAFS